MNQNIINFVKPEMDLFSVGCVIGELFIEESLFDLSALLTYKVKGSNQINIQKKSLSPDCNENSETTTTELLNEDNNKSAETNTSNTSKSPTPIEAKLKELPFNESNKLKKVNFIEIKEIRDLIFNLIDLNPSARKDCAKHLKELFENGVMPKYFFYLYNYLSNLNPLSPDEKIIKLDKDFEQLSEQILEEDCNGFLILINNVLSCYRALIHSYAKITGLNLIIRVIQKISNDNLKSNIILERILPYIMNTITKDTCPKVKSHSIYYLTQLLDEVEIVTVSDKNIFPDYILPALYKIVQDEYALVRTTLAKHLPSLSRIALKFLNICPATAKPSQVYLSEQSIIEQQQKNEDNKENKNNGDKLIASSNQRVVGDQLEINQLNSQRSVAIYNKELKALQKAFQFISYGILTDKEISVRIELMLNKDLVQLCTFFGKQKTNEVIFSHLITFLNERIDFELRLAFYQCIKLIASYLGIHSSPVIKPLLQQGFTDAEETVINQSILTAAYLCNSELMTKKTALELVADSIPLIVHPNLNIRHSMIDLIVNCSQMLSLAELNCRLLPMIKPFLKENEQNNLLYLSNTITDTSLLLDSLVDPVPRTIYDLILNKINATYLLECFFETLEKYQHLARPAQLSLNLNETILNVSSLEAHLSTTGGGLNSSNSPLTNKKSVSSYSNLVNSSTPSNMSVSSFIGTVSGGGSCSANNQQAAAAALSTLTQFLELLIEEGLNDEVKFKLLKMSSLMIRIYKQIKSTKSFITNSQQQQQQLQFKNSYGAATLPPRSSFSPSNNNSSTFQNRLINSNSQRFDDIKQIGKDNKHLYTLNLFNQKYLPLLDAGRSNDWHIPSTISINSTNIESFTNYNLNQEECEIAKEAKENMSEAEKDQEVIMSMKENIIEEYNVAEFGCDQTNRANNNSNNNGSNSNNLIHCPPCVYELQSLFKHKQRKFGEFFCNKIDYDKANEVNRNSLNFNQDQSTASMNSSATTIISTDCLHNAQCNANELTVNSSNLKDGHYALSCSKPKGKLIANLTEHSKSVTKLLTIGNSLFFSSSLDGTIKLWEGDKMNQGSCLVNRSRQTFKMDKHDEWFEGMCYSIGKELLIGYSNKANLYVIKIDNQSSKMTLYQAINDFCKNSMFVNTQNWNQSIFLKGYKPSTFKNLISNKQQFTQSNQAQNYSITDICSSNSPFIFNCSFSNSCIKAFDLRLPLSKSVWTMNTYPNEGLITCLQEGDSCLFAGTSYGHIVTFDTRFQLRSNTMSYFVQRRVRRLLYTPKGLYAAVEGRY